RADFDYILQTDIVYTQVFGNNHFFTSHIGYDFNYLDTLTDEGKEDLASQHNNYFFNNIKAGAGYSTTLKDSFLLKTSIDFLGMFRGTEFFWYILTINKFGYSFQDYFHCYIEGGGKLIEKPEQFWFKEHDYVIFPADIIPGYHWFVKTGIKGSFTGWFSANTDFEFAYNQYAFDWDTSSNEEKLYTLKSFSFMELNLAAGIKFNVKEYFELKIDWLHSFYKKDIFLRMHLRARDNLLTSIKWAIPKIGLSFFITFEGRFYRLDLDNKEMGNIYLMNAGIDWSWQERIGLGTKFNNILYFQNYQLMPGYDEPGFEVLGYIKVGF
ncbi:MAG: hypothetical protein KAT05_10170, partial [Spirochaetes bacterium]|nr:hypothetical protein [Spirochaetota bacterium]